MINQSLRRASGDQSEVGSKQLQGARSSRLDDVSRRLMGRNLEDAVFLGSLVGAFLLALTMLW
jgi:hypothetical protein